MKNKVASLSPLVAATLVCTAAVYASWSAPIMPGPARLGDMVKSLRKLHSVYLKVHVVSPQADRAGITAEKIRARWAQRPTDSRRNQVGFNAYYGVRAPIILLSTATTAQQH